MTNSTIMVTGTTTGIGKAIAMRLAEQGVTVIAHARNAERGSAALADIRARVPKARLELVTADLADPAEVRALGAEVLEKYDRLDVLINNAAMIALRPEQAETMFATNVLAPFLLTNLLLPRLKRVVVVGSSSHKQVRNIPWDDLPRATTYPISKTLNIIYTYELARRATGVTANVADPGFVRTDLGRNVTGGFALFLKLVRPLMSAPAHGAATPVYLATSPDVADVTGACYAKCRPATTSSLTHDAEAGARLWVALSGDPGQPV
jgi:NAD(P)-dependent dehydrogenase (short-subunit alcohol dehydrogenase family)